MQSMAQQMQKDVESRYSINSTTDKLLTLGKRYRYIRWSLESNDNVCDS